MKTEVIATESDYEKFADAAAELYIDYDGLMSGPVGDRWRVVEESLRELLVLRRRLFNVLAQVVGATAYDVAAKEFAAALIVRLLSCGELEHLK